MDESLVHDAITSRNQSSLPAGPRQTGISELEKGRKKIEAQAEDIRRLREENIRLNRRKIEWRDKYHDILVQLDNERAAGVFMQ